MRQSNGFESCRQLQLHFAGGHRAQQFSGKATLDSFQRNTETGHGTISDNVKIATVVQMMTSGINQYDEENYEDYGEEYNDENNEEVDEKYMVAFMKGKNKGKR
eukprot:2835508-Amphidinium_carterae.2